MDNNGADSLNFVDRLVYEDKKSKNIDKIVTRFPPDQMVTYI